MLWVKKMEGRHRCCPQYCARWALPSLHKVNIQGLQYCSNSRCHESASLPDMSCLYSALIPKWVLGARISILAVIYPIKGYILLLYGKQGVGNELKLT